MWREMGHPRLHGRWVFFLCIGRHPNWKQSDHLPSIGVLCFCEHNYQRHYRHVTSTSVNPWTPTHTGTKMTFLWFHCTSHKETIKRFRRMDCVRQGPTEGQNWEQIQFLSPDVSCPFVSHYEEWCKCAFLRGVNIALSWGLREGLNPVRVLIWKK